MNPAISHAQPQLTNTNAFAWEAPERTDGLDHYEFNFDFTNAWRGGGELDAWQIIPKTQTQFNLDGVNLSPTFHTAYVRACNAGRNCSDPASLGFVFTIVIPGVPGIPLNFRIVIVATQSPASVQPSRLPPAPKVKEN